MKELIEPINNLGNNIMKGVRAMIMKLFLFIVFIIMLIIIFITALSNGWVKFVIDRQEVKKDFIAAVEVIRNNSNGNGSIERYNTNHEITDIKLINKRYEVIRHKCKSGETLYDLQERYGTDWRVIKKVNNIVDVRLLRPGQVILVPVKVKRSKLF